MLLFSCSQRPESGVSLGLYIDISSDNKFLLYTVTNLTSDNLYKLSVINNKSDLLYSSVSSYIGYPKFTHFKNKVAFVEVVDNDSKATNLVLFDTIYKTKEILFEHQSLISDFVFSTDGHFVYFISAKSFGHYSPLGRDAPHEMDIYSLAIDSKRIKQITSFNDYSINDLSISPNDSVLYTTVFGKGGICSVDIFSGNWKRLHIKNDPRPTCTVYYIPLFTRDKDIIFYTAPYEINSYNFRTEESKVIVGTNIISSNVYSVCADTNNANLYFTTQENKLYTYSIDESKLQLLPVLPLR